MENIKKIDFIKSNCTIFNKCLSKECLKPESSGPWSFEICKELYELEKLGLIKSYPNQWKDLKN